MRFEKEIHFGRVRGDRVLKLYCLSGIHSPETKKGHVFLALNPHFFLTLIHLFVGAYKFNRKERETEDYERFK